MTGGQVPQRLYKYIQGKEILNYYLVVLPIPTYHSDTKSLAPLWLSQKHTNHHQLPFSLQKTAAYIPFGNSTWHVP